MFADLAILGVVLTVSAEGKNRGQARSDICKIAKRGNAVDIGLCNVHQRDCITITRPWYWTLLILEHTTLFVSGILASALHQSNMGEQIVPGICKMETYLLSIRA